MRSTAVRRIGTLACAATIAAAGGFAGPTSAAQTAPHDTTTTRPCFMVQAHWNNAEGPQPTCATPAWQQATPASSGSAARPAPQARVTDFMP